MLVLVGLLAACLIMAVLSGISNSLFRQDNKNLDRLSDSDKEMIFAASYLRTQFGDSLWKGWESSDIPAMLYNRDYVFVVGYADPPAGWTKVPGNNKMGGVWEPVPDESVPGKVYYRQSIPEQGETPGAFTSKIGNRWVYSLPIKSWMIDSLADDFRGNIPTFLQPILPTQAAARFFLTSAGGRDWYVLGLLHESFHAFEAIRSEGNLTEAENIYNENHERYPWHETQFEADWKLELDLLADAIDAKSIDDTIRYANQFLEQRNNRRMNANLDQELIDLETRKEWEEGLSKYTELAMWRIISSSNDKNKLLTPSLSDLLDDNSFTRYWSQQVAQIRRMADSEGDQRFYYSGFALAAILDKLNPDWRDRIFGNAVTLEGELKTTLDQLEN